MYELYVRACTRIMNAVYAFATNDSIVGQQKGRESDFLFSSAFNIILYRILFIRYSMSSTQHAADIHVHLFLRTDPRYCSGSLVPVVQVVQRRDSSGPIVRRFGIPKPFLSFRFGKKKNLIHRHVAAPATTLLSGITAAARPLTFSGQRAAPRGFSIAHLYTCTRIHTHKCIILCTRRKAMIRVTLIFANVIPTLFVT